MDFGAAPHVQGNAQSLAQSVPTCKPSARLTVTVPKFQVCHSPKKRTDIKGIAYGILQLLSFRGSGGIASTNTFVQ